MAEVSFTLEDIRGVVREEIREEVPALVRPMIEESELRITKAVAASFLEYEQKYDARFDRIDARFDGVDQRLDKIENRLDKVENRLGKVEAEVKGHGRIIEQHSIEIMELKSRPA